MSAVRPSSGGSPVGGEQRAARASLAVSVLLPCFEEAAHLIERVRSIEGCLETLAQDHEIVVVAAVAARDGTPEVAARLAAARATVRLILQPAEDPGYGRAVALGVEAARYPWILLMDADGQFDPCDLPALFGPTPEVPVVIGYRAPRADPWVRRVAGKVNTFAVCTLLGLGDVRDVDCAFKLIRRDLITQSPLRSRTGAVNSEILARVFAQGAAIEQVPVRHLRREGGRSRFEMGGGVLAHLPHPREAAAIMRDVVMLASRRLRGSLLEEDHP